MHLLDVKLKTSNFKTKNSAAKHCPIGQYLRLTTSEYLTPITSSLEIRTFFHQMLLEINMLPIQAALFATFSTQFPAMSIFVALSFLLYILSDNFNPL